MKKNKFKLFYSSHLLFICFLIIFIKWPSLIIAGVKYEIIATVYDSNVKEVSLPDIFIKWAHLASGAFENDKWYPGPDEERKHTESGLTWNWNTKELPPEAKPVPPDFDFANHKETFKNFYKNTEFKVKIIWKGKMVIAPVNISWKSAGPWNLQDNYWNSAEIQDASQKRRLHASLKKGKPASEAAKYEGYLEGKDEAGRLTNGAGIDLSLPLANELGFSGKHRVTVEFLWISKPAIAVTNPEYDNIGAILTNMGHKFIEIQDSQLSDYDFIKQFKSIFINCSEDCEDNAPGAEQSLRDFVNNGGTLYTSDWAFIYVKTSFPGYINFPTNPYIGKKQKIVANIINNNLVNYIGKNTIEIDYNLGEWVPIENVSANTDVYVKGSFEVERPGEEKSILLLNRHIEQNISSKPLSTEVWQNKPLIVGFNYGKGRVYYTTFHNEAQVTEDVVKLLEYLVFKIELDNKIKENKKKLENDGFEVKEENVGGINQNEEKSYTLKVSELKSLAIILNWEGSTLKLSIYRPDGSLYNEYETNTPPIYVIIPDPTQGTWTYTIRAIDVPFNNYSFVVTIGAKEFTPSLKDAFIYPNPYKPYDGNPDTGIPYNEGNSSSGIVFDNLTPDCTIKIFDLAGELIRELSGSFRIQWDAKNDKGREVASGIYIYLIKDKGRNKAKGKVAIIK